MPPAAKFRENPMRLASDSRLRFIDDFVAFESITRPRADRGLMCKKSAGLIDALRKNIGEMFASIPRFQDGIPGSECRDSGVGAHTRDIKSSSMQTKPSPSQSAADRL
jgi:hypothetical protein